MRAISALVCGLALALPSMAAAKDAEGTVLFQRDDTGTAVALSDAPGEAPSCMLVAWQKEHKAAAAIAMDGGGLVQVGMIDDRDNSPLRAAKSGKTLRLAIEADGVRQVYQAKKAAENFVEASPGRASQNRVRAAMRSSEGMKLTLADAEPVVVLVETDAISTFDDCVMSLLRRRMDAVSKRLERLAR